jgi:hypothetical protein
VGEVAAEHEQARAHSPVASARPEVERGVLATCAGSPRRRRQRCCGGGRSQGRGAGGVAWRGESNGAVGLGRGDAEARHRR